MINKKKDTVPVGTAVSERSEKGKMGMQRHGTASAEKGACSVWGIVRNAHHLCHAYVCSGGGRGDLSGRVASRTQPRMP